MVQTVSSLERCPLFRVPSTECSAVLHLYQQVYTCNKNSLAGCICHNLKSNMLAIAVVQVRFDSKADDRKCLINNLHVFHLKSLCAALLIKHFNAQNYILKKSLYRLHYIRILRVQTFVCQ